jgi:starch synthase
MAPFARTGGLGDVVGALPKALAAQGHDVRVMIPLYQDTAHSKHAFTRVLAELIVPMPTGPRLASVWQHELSAAAPQQSVQVYGIGNPQYFDRPGLYGRGGEDYADNAERFLFFCYASLTLTEHLHWTPFVVHCHDWQTALVPALLRFQPHWSPALRTAATVYTIHNLGYQGLFPADIFPRLGLPDRLFHFDGLEFYGQVNFMKAGLFYADRLTTVSPSYAEEICTPAFGVGLDGVLRTRRQVLHGILNGADYDIWSPEQDPLLAAPYNAADLSGKAVCKRHLLDAYGLPEDMQTPVIGMVARLVDQKGLDVLTEALPALMQLNLRLVILGAGEERYEAFLRAQAQRYPERLGVRLGFYDALAHQIEAGSDVFLMPSRYEPCGLNQLYSLRYGTIPIVHAVGGLRDTVEPYQPDTGEGTGFVFYEPSAPALLQAVQAALAAHTDREAWQRLMRRAMGQDFSWQQSAVRYLELYRLAIAMKQGVAVQGL